MALGAVAEAFSAALHKQGLEVSGEEAEHKTVGIQLLLRHCFPSRTQNLLPECVYTVIFEHCVFRDSLALLVFVSKLDFYKNNIWWSCSDFPCSQNYWNDVKKRGSEESWKSLIFSYNFHMQLFYTIKISNAGTHDCMWKGLLIVVNPQRFITNSAVPWPLWGLIWIFFLSEDLLISFIVSLHVAAILFSDQCLKQKISPIILKWHMKLMTLCIVEHFVFIFSRE